MFTGGRPSRNIFSNVPFLRALSATSVCCERRLEVDDRAGRAEVGRRRRVQRLLPLERVDAVVALVVADEGDAVRLAVVAARPATSCRRARR